MILIAGGLFLLAKSTQEIHVKLEGPRGRNAGKAARGTFVRVVLQIMLLDIVFSLDSVITAVGMARHLPVMITAIVVAVGDHDALGQRDRRLRRASPDDQDAGL